MSVPSASGSPIRPCLHRRDELLGERRHERLDDDEALRVDAALAGVDQPRRRARVDRVIEIGVLENDVRIGSAELEDGLLQHGPGLCGHGFSRGRAAGQRHRAHERMLDDGFDLAAADQKRAKHTFRESRLHEHVLDCERATRHVRRVLQYAGISRHQRRRGEPEHLPERKVPRHDGEHDAERLERDVGFRRLGLHDLRREMRLGVLGVVVAAERALLGFRDALLERLPHFERHQPGELFLPLAEHGRGLLHRPRALGERRRPPRLPGGVRLFNRRSGLARRHFVVRLE